MPIFQLFTDVAGSKVTPEFIKSTGQLVAQLLEKPFNRVVVHVQADQKIAVGDLNGPFGILYLRSIGKLGKEENKKYSMAICGHLEKTLGIAPDKMKIFFINLSPSDVGTDNSTYHYILGGT